MLESSFRVPHLSRRGFLMAAGVGLTSVSAFPATPSCSLTAEQEEGPYYIDRAALRRDITEGRPGVPLLLALRLVDAKRCEPLGSAALDIWHCDANGLYSGFTAMSPDRGPGGGRPGPPPPREQGFRPGMPPRSRQTDTTRFLRGVQITDRSGVAEFSTVYPGWYSGRAIHIHLKVSTGAESHVAHTGQLFFPEDLTERIARLEPYAKRPSIHRTTQAEDGIFRSQHGSECMLAIEKLGKAESDGFRATVTLAVDPEANPAPVGRGGPR